MFKTTAIPGRRLSEKYNYLSVSFLLSVDVRTDRRETGARDSLGSALNVILMMTGE